MPNTAKEVKEKDAKETAAEERDRLAREQQPAAKESALETHSVTQSDADKIKTALRLVQEVQDNYKSIVDAEGEEVSGVSAGHRAAARDIAEYPQMRMSLESLHFLRQFLVDHVARNPKLGQRKGALATDPPMSRIEFERQQLDATHKVDDEAARLAEDSATPSERKAAESKRAADERASEELKRKK